MEWVAEGAGRRELQQRIPGVDVPHRGAGTAQLPAIARLVREHVGTPTAWIPLGLLDAIQHGKLLV